MKKEFKVKATKTNIHAKDKKIEIPLNNQSQVISVKGELTVVLFSQQT